MGSSWIFLPQPSGAKRGRWYDHEAGEGGDLLDLLARERGVRLVEAIRIAASEFLSEPMSAIPAQSLDRERTTNDDAASRVRAASRIWRETSTLAGSLGELYFREHRKLAIDGTDFAHALRWHQGIRAVAGLMTNAVTGEPVGLHRTILDSNGAKLERKMLGRQGVVRLSPNSEVTLSLGITEGVEDGLAVLLSGWAPVWAVTSAGAIARFPVLAGIDALTIFADADEPGIHAAETCAARWRAAGRDVRLSYPREMAHA